MPMLPRDRLLGVYDVGIPGPTVIVMTALHGNEAAGVEAVSRVLDDLDARHARLHGRVVGLVGNTRALAEGQRFIARDLNRNWSDEELERVAANPHPSAEDREQLELLAALHEHLRDADRPVVFVDLHSTSGYGIPFACAADVLRNRSIAFDLGIPVVLGLEEVIEGSLLGYMCDHGHIGVVVEGGQHEAPETVQHHESALWLALVSANVVLLEDVPQLETHRRRLLDAAGPVPRVVEIVHRHVVHPEDEFVMRPGYRSFAPVRRGELVADDVRGPIAAPNGGCMLLPRYQGQGDDGFFIARPVARSWLHVSSVARKLLLDRTLRYIPGVDAYDDALWVRGKAAQILSPQLFHLFGYRRSLSAEDGRIFMRRQPDQVGLRLPPALRDKA